MKKSYTPFYGAVKFLVKLALKLFYRRIEVQGLGDFPEGKPVLLAPNHQNAFMDALVPAVFTPGAVHFLVRADVFKSSLAQKFFNALNMMPVYRQRDGLSNLGLNEQIFRQCHEILRRKGTLLIFPEAGHLGQRIVRPLSKGFTRIVFGAQEGMEDLDIQIVPVGLNYSDYTRSHSVLLLNFGASISVNKYRGLYAENPQKAMGQLREELQEKLTREVLHVPSETVHRAFEIEMERMIPFYLHRETGYTLPVRQHYFHQQRIADLEKKDAASEYFSRIHIYNQKMKDLNMRAPFFYLRQQDMGYWIVKGLLLLLVLPFFLLSWALCFPVYGIISLVLKGVKDRQFHSSLKVVGTLVLFPLMGIVFAVLAALFIKPAIPAVLGVLAYYLLSIIIIRELRLPYRYTLSAMRASWLKWRNRPLYRYLSQIEEDIIRTYRD